MSLKHKLQSQLNRLSSGGPHHLFAEDGPHRLRAALLEIHPLACRIDKLAVETDVLRDATPGELKQLGETLAQRITYLLEPISPIEIDREGCVIQLRSNPPQRDDDGASYYELVVRRGGAVELCRYQKRRGNARHPIPATVTQEVLTRLVGDFEAVLR